MCVCDLVGEVAAKILEGKVVCFPTDTVYAMSADPFNMDALRLIYKLKARDRSKALALLVADVGYIQKFACVNDRTFSIILALESKMPGHVTFVLPGDGIDRDILRGSFCADNSVGVRIPNSVVVKAILHAVGGVLVATSVNKTGGVSAVRYEDIEEEFKSSCAVFNWCEPNCRAVHSTVLDMRVEPPLILRQGLVSWNDIDVVIGGL